MQNTPPRWDVTRFERMTRIPQRRTDKFDLPNTSLESPRDKAKSEDATNLRESATSLDSQSTHLADEKPFVGLIVISAIGIGAFFLTDWMTQTISFSVSSFDVQSILYALSGR